MKSTNEGLWKKYIDSELKVISDILNPIGFSLESEQLHISGERYLMTRDKLVLTGRRNSDNKKVVIKVSNKPEGKVEISNEKKTRDILASLAFTKDTLLFPEEIFFGEIGGYVFLITLFIEQVKVLVEHSLEEQFFLAMRAFEAQEAFHATTFEHVRSIQKKFPIFLADEYTSSFSEFKSRANVEIKNESLNNLLTESLDLISKNTELINKYANYLTHTDFAPHNLRISDHSIYMLDCSAIQFGNKYEGWARFLNYMALHNPKLEHALSKYVSDNRGKEESLSLKIMRVYKLGYIIDYYVRSLSKTSGDLHRLTEIRITFWQEVLDAVLHSKALSIEALNSYIKNRDSLRSVEEKKRQKEFAIS